MKMKLTFFLEEINDRKGYGSIFYHKLLSWKILNFDLEKSLKNAYEKVWEELQTGRKHTYIQACAWSTCKCGFFAELVGNRFAR